MKQPSELNGLLQDAVTQYAKSVTRAAFAYLKNIEDAQDVAQEVFLTLLEKHPSFESENHLKAWLLRVAVNKSRRLHSTQPLCAELPALSPQENEVLACVLSLETKYRLPLHLFYYEGYSIREIAGILQLRPATVGTRLARGRALLRQMIGGTEYET